MSDAATAPASRPTSRGLGLAWTGMWLALAVHVTDEALTGFLSVYNPTVTALRARFGFWPMPTYNFRDWLTGLIAAVVLLAALTPFAFRNAPWIRPVLYFCAIVIGIFNALGHTLGTVFGQTRQHSPIPAPGARFLFLSGAAGRRYVRAGPVKTNQTGLKAGTLAAGPGYCCFSAVPKAKLLEREPRLQSGEDIPCASLRDSRRWRECSGSLAHDST